MEVHSGFSRPPSIRSDRAVLEGGAISDSQNSELLVTAVKIVDHQNMSLCTMLDGG